MGRSALGARRALWDVAVGVAASVVAFAAVPGVLAGFVGVPFPSWSRHAIVSLHGLFDLLAIVAWIAWAACAWPLLRSVVVRVRARDATAGEAPAGLRMGDRLALRIAAAVLAVAPVAAAGAAGAGAATLSGTTGRLAPGTVTVVRSGSDRDPVGAVARSHEPPPDTAADEVPVVVAVAGGDSLWSIAETAYEDGAAWPAIAAANLGRVMGDGTRFVDPNVVLPGWTLLVPPLEPAAEPAAEIASAGQSKAVTLPGPAGPSNVVTASTRPLPRRRGGDHPGAVDRSRPHRSSSGSPAGLLVPELAILGAGALVAALLARRSRQAQRLRSFVRDEGSAPWQPSEDAADLGRAVGSFEDLPLLQWIELAMRMIGASPEAWRDGIALPPLQLLRAGPDGVEVRFASTAPSPHTPWVPAGARAWLLPASVDPEAVRAEARRHRPWSPILLPLGEDDQGSWLLPLTAGTCLSVIGPAAHPLAHAMIAGAESWTWREELVITGDPRVAAEAAGASEPRPDGTLYPSVVFTGDPRSVATAARRGCVVVTLAPAATADVSVIVDERAATVHPLGLTVRPHLLRSQWSGTIAELCTLENGDGQVGGQNGHHPRGPVDGRGDDPHDGRRDDPHDGRGDDPHDGRGDDPHDGRRDGRRDGPTGGFSPPAPAFRQHRPDAATVRVHAGTRDPGSELSLQGRPDGRGAIGVRLLAPIPSIDGLPEPLPPKRARRATEVIAYLALHAPQPVTGDRLRTRVLGTTDTDAASKTLFNTVGAARRALGPDAEGLPLLPPATRSGQYRLSSSVSVDALRCVALMDAGRTASDAAERISLLEAALSLVEGEPLSGVLTGYTWWRAEGHERRVADAVVDGTCALVRAAVEARRLDLGRWALERARLIEPYSEALTRVAMALAAAAGDARRLHLEWQECRRQVDELDPGGAPSEATERLYARLRQHLRGGVGAADEPTAVLGV